MVLGRLRRLRLAALFRRPAPEAAPGADPVPRAAVRPLDCALVFGIGLAVFCTLVAALDNVHVGTTNGLWKSLDLAKWVEGSADRRLEPSNLLYYPAHGWVLRNFLPESVFGPVWKRMAYLNAFYGALALVFTHLLVAGLTRSRLLACCATLFQMGCGFFLLLSVINEDIMASYACLAGALALAVVSWDRPSVPRVAGVGVLFSLSWLFEWRVMFPTLPALTLACLMLPFRWPRRVAWAGVFLGSVVLTAACAALLARGNPGVPKGFSNCFGAIVWTGKGIGTGWGGFRTEKFELLRAGVAQSLLGGRTWSSGASVAPRVKQEMLVSLGLLGVLAGAFLVRVALNRDDARHRVAFAALGGTLFCGQVMNLYSQPQDPQMQINAMAWLAAGWALLGAVLLAAGPLRTRSGVALFLAASLLPLGYNARVLWKYRGRDSENLRALDRLKGQFDLKDTLFVVHGFEGIRTWWAVEWGQSQTSPPVLDPPPRREGSVAGPLCLVTDLIYHPARTPAEHVRELTDHIDRALELGYRVVINQVWDVGEEEMVCRFVTVSGPEKPRAIYKALHERYRGTLVYTDPMLGTHYELRRADTPAAHGGSGHE